MVFHESPREACFVLTEISGNLREFRGEGNLGILYVLLFPPNPDGRPPPPLREGCAIPFSAAATAQSIGVLSKLRNVGVLSKLRNVRVLSKLRNVRVLNKLRNVRVLKQTQEYRSPKKTQRCIVLLK